MKITFKAGDLKESVSRSVKFTDSKAFQTIHEYFCFDDISLIATDGNIGIIQTTTINFSEKVLVPGEIFTKAILNLENQEIEMTTVKNDVTVKSGRFKTKFRVIDTSSYPKFVVPWEGVKEMPDVGFMAGIKQVRFSVSDDLNKPEMRGVYFDGSHYYSTDNYRITRFALQGEPVEESVLISEVLLATIVGEGEPNGYCLAPKPKADGFNIWFLYDEFVAFGEVPKGEFPDCKTVFVLMEKQIVSGDLKEVKFDRLSLMKTLERFSMYKIESPNRVDVTVKPGELRVFLVTSEGNETVEDLAVDTKATGSFSVNLNYLKEAVGATERFFMPTGKKAPIFFKSESGLETLLLPLEVGSVAERKADVVLGGTGNADEAEEPARNEADTTNETTENRDSSP